MSTTREAVVQGLKPLFDRAEREGLWFFSRYQQLWWLWFFSRYQQLWWLWFFSRYQQLWFSPQELRDQHAQGGFFWGAVNWELRRPEEHEAELGLAVAKAMDELDEFRKRMGYEL